MKRMKCEMCGGTDLIKQDGFFVCQNCFTKYSVEEAKKIMVEFDGPVEITGTVKLDKNYDTIAKLADESFKNGNYKEAYDYYTQFVEQFPDDYERKMKRALSYGWGIKLGERGHVDMSVNYVDEYCKCILEDEKLDDETKGNKIAKAFDNVFSILVAIFNLGRKIYVDNGVTSSSSHGAFLDVIEFVVNRQFLLINLSEKYLKYSLGLENIWRFQCKNIDVEIGMFSKTYRFGDNTFFLSSTGRNNYNKMFKTNEDNKHKIDLLISEIKKRIQLERNAAYWEKNEKLKEDLLSEKARLESDNNALLENVGKLEKEIEDIKNSFKFDGSSFDISAAEYTKEINELELNLKSLGLFKLKEKKETKEKINVLKKELDKVNDEKEQSKADFDKEVSAKCLSQLEQISLLKDKISENNNKIDGIESKLNANY